jgi:hypothetical protein
MAGLVPAIHVLLAPFIRKKDVDARHKARHDDVERTRQKIYAVELRPRKAGIQTF